MNGSMCDGCRWGGLNGSHTRRWGDTGRPGVVVINVVAGAHKKVGLHPEHGLKRGKTQVLVWPGIHAAAATIGAVIRQTSPNDGTLAAVGKLGVDAAETYAFDVATDAEGNNKAWLATGTWLHTVSLETGKVTDSWELSGLEWPLRDITFMTAM